MKTAAQRSEIGGARLAAGLLLLTALVLASACQQLEKPSPKAFYSETIPPRAQEFRWSNGRMPASFDPAFAAAPPETDIARAIFDGLTEIDPKTLEAIPSLALKWESSDGGRQWTFELRKDARWTNGDPVTAEDFVRSWRRLAEMEEKPAHFGIVSNISGMAGASTDDAGTSAEPSAKPEKDALAAFSRARKAFERNTRPADAPAFPAPPAAQPRKGEEKDREFGVEAPDPYKLQVTLVEPDAFFPRLAAHPVLRPVHKDGAGLGKSSLSRDIVTNGAFVVETVEDSGVTLVRSETYYAKSSVKLERASLTVPKDADSALADYREGRVDAVTNTEFEPLALKLLTPYVDFRRTTHSALNFYEFNRSRAPFNDRRVREAMAIAIDRKRLTDDLMDGATEPAYGFLPFGSGQESARLKVDVARAKDLMQKAGFEGGRDFPVVRLVINRNDLQQKVAVAVAGMWRENLGIETEITILEYEELESVRASGDFDLVRRNEVLPTSDETANMLAVFGAPAAGEDGEESPVTPSAPNEETGKQKAEAARAPSKPTPDPMLGLTEFDGLPPAVRDELMVEIGGAEERPILTADEAVLEVPAIPLYFPTSYSLVKPYVFGFDINPLDAPLLKAVSIDSRWRPVSGSGA